MLSRLFTCLSLLVSLSVNATENITVFAAASMTDALDEIAQRYERENDIKIKRSYASSSVLARQIAQGAPADLFISANTRWMDYLVEQNAVEPDSVAPLVRNELVMVVPSSEPVPQVSFTSASDILKLLQGTRLAVGDPKHVPAGIYTQQALETLGMWQSLMPVLARANNVRSALLWVERGEARAGVVYRTDAMVSDKVAVISTFPSLSHDAIEYPVAIVTGKSQNETTQDFYDYLKTKEAKQVFRSYGFLVE
ncbi:molybdate ABC transporter substrate-binding protein [Vibrio astriarenae]|jgi:molybdate transport system substrate-binding protein